jgi:hypothetical protein
MPPGRLRLEVAILYQNFSRERKDLRGLWNRFQFCEAGER